MATYADLQATVQALTKRQQFFDPLGNDVTAQALGLFVNSAVRAVERLLVIRDAEVTATLTIGPSNYPFPIGNLSPSYRYSSDLWLQGASVPLYRYQTVREFHQDYPPSVPASSGTVTRGYCIYDGSIFLGPEPVQDWTYYWDYVTWLPPFSKPDDSNWYTQSADDAVMWFACREAASWLQEDQLYQFYDQRGQRALDEVRKTLRNEEVAEGQWQARLFGSFRSAGQPAAHSRGSRGPGWMP
jgi:hypothetical protein